ncbi:sperm-associated antigen 17-like [Styela clava]
MSKKRGKSSSAPGHGGRWETDLIAHGLEDENWKISITFVVENKIEDSLHIKHLANVVKVPQRRLFSFIHKDELMALIDEIGNPKTRKTKELPHYFEITEVIKSLLDGGEEIPIHLWAKLIKFSLLNVKSADLKRRDAESKTKDEKEKGGKGSGKKRPRSKSPGKGGKGKKTPEPQMPKKDWSTLKKRGEEDTDNKYIDDEPDDGPHHYVFVSGFRQAQLFPLLVELGVNVSSIIKLYSESYLTVDSVLSQTNGTSAGDASKDEEALAAEKAKKEMNEKELAVFWKLLPTVLQRAAPNSTLQDLARLEYSVADMIHPTDWNDADNLVGYGTALFEDMACLVYNSLDWRRQYLNYLKNMNIIHIPMHGEAKAIDQQMSGSSEPHSTTSASGKRDKGKAPAAEAPSDDLIPPIVTEQVTKEVDMRYYNDLMDLVPQESVSVPLLMHCMLEQIEASEQDLTPPSEIPREQRNDGIHLSLADCISDALENLALTEEERKDLSQDFPTLEKNFQQDVEEKNKKLQSPSLMQYGDDMTVRTHHLDKFNNFDPRKAEESLLQRLPCTRLWNYQQKNPQLSKERSARLQELLRNCATLSEESEGVIAFSDIDRAFRQFVFETINLSTVDEDGNIVKVTPEVNQESPWDDPYTLAVKSSPSNAEEEKEQEEIAGNKETEKKDDALGKSINIEKYPALNPKRILDSWCYAEHFHPEVFLQVLTEATENYPSLDTYYHKRDHSLLAVFHCPMNKKLQATEEWSTSLHSDVGFRNYLEYVSEPIADWTRSEEEKYQAELLKKELEKIQASQVSTEASTTPPPSTGAGKRPRSKSPKKGSRRGSASRSSSKVGGTDDSQTYSSPYIRTGSLKAQSEEQAKIREEEEKRKAEKDSKQQARVKSGDKSKQSKSAVSKTSQDGKRPGSGKASRAGRRSSKSKSGSRSRSRSRSGSQERVVEIQQPELVEPALPFTGYDVGNNLINMFGKTSYLYPCDGGIIKSEKIVCEQGSTTVSTTVRKDGHMFLVHMIDPKDPEEHKEFDELTMKTEEKADEITEKAELESPEKDQNEDPMSRRSSKSLQSVDDKPCHSTFGSWNGVLSDGMTLSFSSHGEEGECSAAAKAEKKLMKILGEVPPASSPSPVPLGMETPGKKGKGKGKSPRGRSPRGKSPKGKRRSDSEREAEAQRLEEERLQEELERKLREAKEAEEQERSRIKLPPFQQLYVSTPDGLSVRYQLDPTMASTNFLTGENQYKLMVRQCYPYKTLGKQKTESLRAHPAMEEVSRCIKSDGTVIKVMKDGSTMVLFADGTTCFNQGTGPLVQERKIPVTPHSMPSAVAQQLQTQASTDEQRNSTSPGSKKGSKGRKSSGKTNPNTTATDPSVAGTDTGGGAGGTLTAAAGLEADAGATAEADLEKAASWHTVCMNGERYVTKPNGEKVNKEPLFCYSATDPVTGEVLLSREDHVIRVERPDGSVVCDHSDGTRITQYNREIEKALYEAEGEDETSVNASNTVRHVRVECPGYATISFNCDEGSCLTVFGSGTNLLTSPDSTYQMSHWNGGRIDIDCDGAVTYTPRPDNDLYAGITNETETEEGTNVDNVFQAQMTPLGSYIMRHNADVCCEALDHEGNVFQVKKFGDISVTNAASDGASGAGESASILPQVSTTSDPLDHHPPRFFIIHENGTGTELLRYKDVQEYLADAQLDPTTAVIKEPLPDTPGVVGITVMRPHFGNSSEAWLTQKLEENIIPENIRSRDLALFPQREEKTTGPPFGTTAGKGLAVGSAPGIPEPPPVPPCPAVLELRQLVQFNPVSSDLRSHLRNNLIEIGNMIKNREKQRQEAEVNDPRSWDEKVRANDLLSLVLEFDEGQVSPKSPTAPQPSGQPAEGVKTATKASAVHNQQSPNVIRAIYEEAVTPPPMQKPDPPRNKLTQDDWDRIRRSIDEEKLGRGALKHRDVPPYFESEEGRAWLMTQAPDLEALSRQLAPDPRKDGTEAKMARKEKVGDKKSVSQTTPARGSGEPLTTPSQSRASENGATTNIPVSDTPSKMRPTNPTPGHASGSGTPTKVRPENPTPFAASQARQAARPSNPTPSHAYSGESNATRQSLPDVNYGQFQPSPIPENPTSAQRREGASFIEDSSSSSGMMMQMETTGGSDLVLTRSLLYDVNGEPRKEKVKLPASILSDKPAAFPNKQFTSVEDPVRRKVKTSSVAESVMRGNAKRGFELLPPEIIFGVLKEGNTYSYTARLKNTGIDTCRFKIKQPPPGTGLRVHYTPGPVAAGMDTLLHIECYAIAVGVEGDSGVGTINHQMEIITETETLCLPISAIVLTSHDYENRSESMPPGGKAPGVKLLSAKPPSREGIVRPMKVAS